MTSSPSGGEPALGDDVATTTGVSDQSSVVPADLRSYLFDVLFASSQVGLALFDRQGVLVDCNDAMSNWLGRRRDDIVGRNFTDLKWTLVHEDGSPFSLHETAGATGLRTSSPVREVVMGIDVGDRPRRWLAVTSYPAVFGGVVHGVISSYTDVTERVGRERMLRLLARVQAVLITGSRRDDTLRNVCSVLVDESDVDCVAFCDESGDEARARTVASAGDLRFLTALNDGSTPSPAVNELVRDAWRSRHSTVAHHVAIAWPADGGLDDPVRIVRSVAALPLGEEQLVLVLFARRVAMFDHVVVEGLEQILRDVDHALVTRRADERISSTLAVATRALEGQRNAEKAQVIAEQRFELAFEENMSPMIVTDTDDAIIAANRAFCNMVGYPLQDVLGHDSTLFTHPDDQGLADAARQQVREGGEGQVRYVKRYRHSDGRMLWVEVSRSAARDANGQLLYYVISERDITEERALGAQLAHRALHDPLTGTANRALFDDRLAQAHARTLRQHEWGAVLLIDLDDFKGVNDTYGHLAGDQLLTAVARRFEGVVRASDTLARFGGDEFLYLAVSLSAPDEAHAIATRLIQSLTRPFAVGDLEIVQSASVGASVWNQTRVDPTSLVQEADIALYEAKAHHRGRAVFFTPAMHDHATARFTLRQDLRSALRESELEMHYQPIVSVATLEVIGLEALMRWHHPTRGWIPPQAFIDEAEDSDMISDLGLFALDQAVRTVASLTGTTSPFISVNFSARQFHDPNLVNVVTTVLEEGHLDPRRLVVEITESVTLVDAADSLLTVERLTGLGIRIALDDFGTGYSSLSYLASLRPSIIKIDQSFIQPLPRRPLNEDLFGAIVSLGHQFHTTMLAEGVETESQLEVIRRLDCDLAQGFLFSRAVPAESLATLLEEGPAQWAEAFGHD